jgi:hypothetical protein
LFLGNSFSDPPEKIIERCYSDFFVKIAKHVGFDKLYDLLEKKGMSIPNLKKFSEVTSVCEVCSMIHGDSAIMDQLGGVLAEMEIDYCIDRFSRMEAKLEEDNNVPTRKELEYASDYC